MAFSQTPKVIYQLRQLKWALNFRGKVLDKNTIFLNLPYPPPDFFLNSYEI